MNARRMIPLVLPVVAELAGLSTSRISGEIGFGKISSAARILLVLLVTCLASSVASAQPGGVPAVNVSTVETREVTSQQTFIGTVTPTRRAILGSAVADRVESVPVDDGNSRLAAGCERAARSCSG